MPLLNGDGDGVAAEEPNGEVVVVVFPKGEGVFAVAKGDGEGARPPKTKGDAAGAVTVLPLDGKGDIEGLLPPKGDACIGGVCEGPVLPNAED